MNVESIIFYNYEKNGDCFVNKGYVADIIKKLPDVKFAYAHDHHESLIRDLDCRFIRTFQIPREIDTKRPMMYHEDSGTLFINTWIGAWIGKYLELYHHANFPLIHRAWKEYYDALGLPMGSDFIDYAPEIDYTKFDLSAADQYLDRIKGKPLVLICNGIPQSGQSSMGNMANTINAIAQHYENYEFVVAYKLGLNLPNVTYTDDIFNAKEGNMNQISYIGTHARLIIGKNSGPFSFCHTKQMMRDPEKIFLSFNHRPTDCLMGAGTYNCNSFFNASTDEQIAAQVIAYLLNRTDYTKDRKETGHIQVEMS